MYAVIQTGGKQYKVKEGDVIEVEKLDYKKPHQEMIFNQILLCVDGDNISVGKPIIEGAKVKAEILGDMRGRKIVTYKYKRRKSYHRTIGHRQNYTRVKIKEISLG